MANSTLDLARSVRAKLEKEKDRLAKLQSPWLITSEIPEADLLVKLFDIVYYTSLKTEEGRPVVTRLCLVNPDKPEDSPPPMPRLSRWQLVPLAERLPLTVPALVKIAKAADPWSSALAVFFDERREPYIWGLIDQTCTGIECSCEKAAATTHRDYLTWRLAASPTSLFIAGLPC